MWPLPLPKRSGVATDSEYGPVTLPDFASEVDRRVAENTGNGGWDNGPVSICDEVAEELVDVAGWLRGLEQYEMTPEQRHRIDTIVADASLIWDAVAELKATYRPG